MLLKENETELYTTYSDLKAVFIKGDLIERYCT